MSLTLALLLQVGFNPTPPLPGAEEEMLNRPPRGNPAEASENPTSAWHSACLDQLEADPSRAHTQAQIRRNETSGTERVLANHCLGLAATELGLWDDAQTAFTAAYEETPDDELQTQARFALMAGNAALAGGDLELARIMLAAAASRAGSAQSATLEALALTDLARVFVALDLPDEALTTLDKATTLEPGKGEAWLLKATLLRRLDRLDEAQAAIERAVELTPQDAQVGLEAGVIAVLSGREEAARASWQSVLDTQPDSLAAQTAKEYLAQLGAEPEAQP